ncbi:MAG: hypothetical protein HOP07_13850 [Bacteriovoracaceae bacterium]|nr:hypothetical protein [Bacteriovoracaceae bacterium]
MKRILLLGFILTISSCGDFKQDQLTTGLNANTDVVIDNLESINTGTFSIDKVLLNFGLNVMTPSVFEFNKNIVELNSHLELYCDAIENYPVDHYKEETFQAQKRKLQDQWKKTMSTYHRLEAFKFGAISSNAEELGLSFYAWPLQNSCRIDLEIAKNTGKNENEMGAKSFNLMGLGALETILFTKPGSHNCPTSPAFLTKWINEAPKTRHIDQCSYMKNVTKTLMSSAKVLSNKWDPKVENFSLTLVKGKSRAQKLSSLNEFSNSLFYVEKIVKDLKIGAPSGILNCKLTSCPESSEHILSKLSIEAVISNLKGFHYAFNGIDPETGVNGMGMDDYLVSQNHWQTAKAMNSAVTHAIERFSLHVGKKSLYELSLEVSKNLCDDSTSENRTVEICALYQDLRGVTNILKNDYILALRDIEAPAQSQGDMD